MKILKSLIDKKLENRDIFEYNRKKEFALAEHIASYVMAMCYLGLFDKNLTIKTRLWNKFTTSEDRKQKTKYYKRLLLFKPDEHKIIVQALKKIEDEKLSGDSYLQGSLWKPLTLGVSSFEFDSEE